MERHSRAQVALYAVDPDRLVHFYADVTGLQVAEASDGFVTLTSDALELHLVRVPDELAATIELPDPVVRRVDTPIKVSFAVANINDAPTTEWVWRGEAHCDGHDPEGNVFQVRAQVTN